MNTKIKSLATLLIISILSVYIHVPVLAENDLPSVGKRINGFVVTDTMPFDYVNADIITFEHEKTGAEVLYCANDDINRAFNIAFRTPAVNNSGTTHIFEHSTLAGSENYPSSTLWMKLSNQSYNTFMNAMTGQNTTTYPLSSLSEEQLYQLSDYYLDSVFNPMVYTDESIFDREAWHYELESASSPLTVDGTVFSEMQGHDTIQNESIYNVRKTLFPDSYSANVSGGDPYYIPDITNDDLVEYHKTYYHPSNSFTMIYGDLDYENFLALLDSYFSKYERADIKVDFENHTPTDDELTAVYDFPVSSNQAEKDKPVIAYAIECDDADVEDLAKLEIVSSLCTGMISGAVTELYPEMSVSYFIDLESAKPTVIFLAYNAQASQAEEFGQLVEELFEYILYYSGIDEDYLESVLSSVKRSEAKGFDVANAGVTLAMSAAEYWSKFDDADFLFDYLGETLSAANTFDNDELVDIVRNFFVRARKALVTTVPKQGLAEEETAAFEQKLSDIKAAMTDEEIQKIIEKTEIYNNYTGEENAELDKDLINKIAVVDAHSLLEEVPEYEITDTTKDGVRYVTSVADIQDIGKGRIMLDVSDVSADDLHWLSLYSALIGMVDTNMYTKYELSTLFAEYADCEIDIMTLFDDNPNGFIPYLIFKYEGFADDSDMIFDIADQILLRSDFSDMEHIRGLLSQYENAITTSIDSEGISYVGSMAEAASDTHTAYYEKLNGLGFYEFIKSLKDMSDDEIIAGLEKIRDILDNKNGASIVYAGSKDSIQKNTAQGEKFFKKLTDTPKTAVDYSSLKEEYQNNALVINSPVNYNGIHASIDKLGMEYDGSLDIIMNYVTDRFLIPTLRDKYNAYGVVGSASETGVTIYSYDDPEMANTFDVYSQLSEMVAGSDITQEELDKYILTVYSSYITPGGELHDAYWAASDYTDGITAETRRQTLRDMKSATPEKVKAFADVLQKLWDEGIIFTAGNSTAISENAHMFDEIFNPFGYAVDFISIYVSDDRLKTDIAAYIENDRVMVPMRNIFEALEAEVTWNGETREVTAVREGITVVMTIDSNVMTVTDADGNTQTVELDCPAVIKNDFTMIPLRAISESLGFEVGWDGETRTVYVD